MGKLLRDHQLHVVASPTTAEEEVRDAQQFLEHDDVFEHHDDPRTRHQPSFHAEPAFDEYGASGDIDSSARMEETRFDTPRPPGVPYFQRQRELFEGYRHNPTHHDALHDQRRGDDTGEIMFEALDGRVGHDVNIPEPETEWEYQRQRESFEEYYPEHTNEASHNQPQRDMGELLEAVNGHIENIDQQMHDSNSLRSGVDEQFSQPETEWEYDASDERFRAEGGHASAQYDALEANGSTYYFEAADEVRSDERAPERPSELENQELRRELERPTAEKRAAEESAARAERELREKE